eukprot:gene4308-4560_t
MQIDVSGMQAHDVPIEVSRSYAGTSFLTTALLGARSADVAVQPACLAAEDLPLSAFAAAAEGQRSMSCSGLIASATGSGCLHTKQGPGEQQDWLQPQLVGSTPDSSNTEPAYTATYSNALFEHKRQRKRVQHQQPGKPEHAQQLSLSPGQADQAAAHVATEVVVNMQQLSPEAAVTPEQAHMQTLYPAAWPGVKQQYPLFEAHLLGTSAPAAPGLMCLGHGHESAYGCINRDKVMPEQLDFCDQPSLHAGTWSATAADDAASAFLPAEKDRQLRMLQLQWQQAVEQVDELQQQLRQESLHHQRLLQASQSSQATRHEQRMWQLQQKLENVLGLVLELDAYHATSEALQLEVEQEQTMVSIAEQIL